MFSEIIALFSKTYEALKFKLWAKRGVLILTYVMNTASMYRGDDKSLARPPSQCILLDGENISFEASLVICINSTIFF